MFVHQYYDHYSNALVFADPRTDAAGSFADARTDGARRDRDDTDGHGGGQPISASHHGANNGAAYVDRGANTRTDRDVLVLPR